MDGEVAIRKLRCGARVHAWLVNRRYLRRHCTDRRCREAQWAKQRGEVAIHVWDVLTDAQWTEYEPADTGKENTDGRNRHLQP